MIYFKVQKVVKIIIITSFQTNINLNYRFYIKKSFFFFFFINDISINSKNMYISREILYIIELPFFLVPILEFLHELYVSQIPIFSEKKKYNTT